MKTFTKTDFANLDKELHDNEKQIAKLQNRNEQIRNAFTILQTLTTSGKFAKMGAKSESPMKGKLKRGSTGDRIMEILKDGTPQDVLSISRAFYNREPTQKEVDAVANICSQLARVHGKARRVKRGVYQTNFPEIIKEKATIGHDTRVTNIGRRELLPEMTPSREREIKVIKGDANGVGHVGSPLVPDSLGDDQSEQNENA